MSMSVCLLPLKWNARWRWVSSPSFSYKPHPPLRSVVPSLSLSTTDLQSILTVPTGKKQTHFDQCGSLLVRTVSTAKLTDLHFSIACSSGHSLFSPRDLQDYAPTTSSILQHCAGEQASLLDDWSLEFIEVKVPSLCGSALFHIVKEDLFVIFLLKNGFPESVVASEQLLCFLFRFFRKGFCTENVFTSPSLVFWVFSVIWRKSI